ncbi:ribonuclease P protein subunit p21 isoform X4 [Ciconia boyciana]|uniref:ribonuclease P protein subunit p21 isoform X4 n=1 Tax=Ciconia boyciana TaxID=52775 RepID=UPI003B9E30DB
MGSVGPAHPAEARPIGSAMAAPVRDREALQRLSFLFQAAHWVLPHSPALARFYCSTQRGAARRLVLRMDPSVKRAVCRRCCSLLLPGAGAACACGGEGSPAPSCAAGAAGASAATSASGSSAPSARPRPPAPP